MRVRGYAPATPCWAELVSPDPAGAEAFYCGLFGWEAASNGVGGTTFTLAGAAAAGVVPAPAEGHPAAWLTYIATEDIGATMEAVAAGGGTVLQPPTSLGERGQLATFVDPEGAVLGLWQRGTFRGAQVANEPGATCWSDVASRDRAGASAFYGKVFGWTEQPGTLVSAFEYWEWSLNNRVLAGMTPMGEHYPAEVPAHWRTTFEVADCAAAVERCGELGGRALVGPLDTGVGHYAQLLDPQGGSFGVMELIPELRLTP